MYRNLYIAPSYKEPLKGNGFVMAAADVGAGTVLIPHRLPTEEEVLLDQLFKEYNPTARPVINSNHTVHVTVQLSLLQIQELVCIHSTILALFRFIGNNIVETT